MHQNAPDQKKRLPKVLRLALKLSMSLLIAFVFAEILLRFIPMPLTDFHSTFQFEGDADLGFRALPGQDAVYNLDCMRNAHVRTNSQGMRGPEWQDGPGPKIALLGDSYMLALTVSDQWHLANQLQTATGGTVWNAGISGYGTYQELLVWRKLVRQRKPDVTVLFMYMENDIRDNLCGLCRAEGQRYCPCLSIEDGDILPHMDFELRKPETGIKAWFKQNCLTYRILHNLRRNRSTKPASGNFFDQPTFAYNIYRPGHTRDWEEGWQVTAWTLQTLKRECDAIGSKLLVVNVPGVIQLAPDWRAEIAKQIQWPSIPADFDIHYPLQRLQAITDSARIDLLDLQPAFLAYRDQHRLPEPNFGWCCDGHWNPVGHRLASDLVYNWMAQARWIPGQAKTTPAPLDILGKELMDEIYTCGTAVME